MLQFQSLIEDHDLLDRVDLPSPPSAASAAVSLSSAAADDVSVAAADSRNFKPLCINIPQPSGHVSPSSAAAIAVQQQVAAAAAEGRRASPPNSPAGTLRLAVEFTR